MEMLGALKRMNLQSRRRAMHAKIVKENDKIMNEWWPDSSLFMEIHEMQRRSDRIGRFTIDDLVSDKQITMDDMFVFLADNVNEWDS